MAAPVAEKPEQQVLCADCLLHLRIGLLLSGAQNVHRGWTEGDLLNSRHRIAARQPPRHLTTELLDGVDGAGEHTTSEPVTHVQQPQQEVLRLEGRGPAPSDLDASMEDDPACPFGEAMQHAGEAPYSSGGPERTTDYRVAEIWRRLGSRGFDIEDPGSEPLSGISRLEKSNAASGGWKRRK